MLTYIKNEFHYFTEGLHAVEFWSSVVSLIKTVALALWGIFLFVVIYVMLIALPSYGMSTIDGKGDAAGPLGGLFVIWMIASIFLTLTTMGWLRAVRKKGKESLETKMRKL